MLLSVVGVSLPCWRNLCLLKKHKDALNFFLWKRCFTFHLCTCNQPRIDMFLSVVTSLRAQVIKNPPANSGNARDAGSIPGLERSPGEGNGNALRHSCLENSMDRGAWQGHKELDTTEQVSTFECIKDLFPRVDIYWFSCSWKKPAILHCSAVTLVVNHVLAAPDPLFCQKPCALHLCQRDYDLRQHVSPTLPVLSEAHSAAMHMYVHKLGHTSTVCGNYPKATQSRTEKWYSSLPFSSSNCFFFLAIAGPVPFYMNFRISLSISTKEKASWDFVWGDIELRG